MAEKQFDFAAYLKEEAEKVRESYYPVQVNLFTRLMKKTAKTGKLHPNPDDEFCFPEIGPNYSIIASYAKAYSQGLGDGKEWFGRGSRDGAGGEYDERGNIEPLTVQKTRPDGYMILNGHHRWAAALKSAVPRVRIRIVNLTQVEDVRDMLARSRADRRVTVDLDEVVFAGKGETTLEKPMPFPLNRFFRERVRSGIPALFHTLSNRGYDIWAYSAGYYSMDYIRHYFKAWNVRLAGIVTGTGRKIRQDAATDHEIKRLMDIRYSSTLHIDRSMVIRTFSGSREREEYQLSGSPDSWVREVTDIVMRIAKEDREKEG